MAFLSQHFPTEYMRRNFVCDLARLKRFCLNCMVIVWLGMEFWIFLLHCFQASFNCFLASGVIVENFCAILIPGPLYVTF